MRASRLTAIALLLEGRGRMTAQELADEFEVSVRTIFRDMDALAAAGVPVYAERGAAGGYRLMEGYRMRPPGLTSAEAGALWLAGLPDAVRRLGWGPALAGAQAKLLAVMGPEQRRQTALMRERLYVEGASWFGAPDEPPHLAVVTDAAFSGRVIRVRYRSWSAERTRTLEPLGLVLKGGTWYLVAQDHDAKKARTYRVAAIQSVELLDEYASRPAQFDLAGYWKRASAEFIGRVYALEAVLRISPEGLRQVTHLGTAVYTAGMRELGEADALGWREVRLPFETVEETARDLFRLGGEAEVLAPPALREEMRRLARDILARLEDSEARAVSPGGGAGIRS
ncbi:MAG: helix-turn-helix transcriptional regulator [Clostridia bacterium]